MAEETETTVSGMVERVEGLRTLAKEAADAPLLSKAQAVQVTVNAAIDVMADMAARLDEIGGVDAQS
ncbi:MAG: hypothetical protein ACRBBO_05925 [Cognatishimia sp.]